MKLIFTLSADDLKAIEARMTSTGPSVTNATVTSASANGVIAIVVEPASEPAPPLPAPAPGRCVQVNPPLSVTGQATLFGLDWNGSPDEGDNGEGFFIDPSTGTNYITSVQTLAGISLPREVMLSTFLHVDDWTTNGIDATWREHAGSLSQWVKANHPLVTIDSGGFSAVAQPFVDAGPSAGTDNAIDLTYFTAHALNTQGDAIATYMILVAGKPVAIRGWDFSNNRVGLVST